MEQPEPINRAAKSMPLPYVAPLSARPMGPSVAEVLLDHASRSRTAARANSLSDDRAEVTKPAPAFVHRYRNSPSGYKNSEIVSDGNDLRQIGYDHMNTEILSNLDATRGNFDHRQLRPVKYARDADQLYRHHPVNASTSYENNILVEGPASQISAQLVLKDESLAQGQAQDVSTTHNRYWPTSDYQIEERAHGMDTRVELASAQTSVEQEKDGKQLAIQDEETIRVKERPFIIIHAVLIASSLALVIVVETACAAKVSSGLVKSQQVSLTRVRSS